MQILPVVCLNLFSLQLLTHTQTTLYACTRPLAVVNNQLVLVIGLVNGQLPDTSVKAEASRAVVVLASDMSGGMLTSMDA